MRPQYLYNKPHSDGWNATDMCTCVGDAGSSTGSAEPAEAADNRSGMIDKRRAEKMLHLLVKFISMFLQGPVSGVGHDPEIGVLDVLIDEDGVRNRNQVVIAANDQRRALNGV